MGMSVWPMMLLLMMRGSANELLDYVPTAGYWQAKAVTVSVEGLLAELTPERIPRSQVKDYE